jgi:hypothetical protein
VVHEYKYCATHRRLMRRMILSFVRVCTVHCNMVIYIVETYIWKMRVKSAVENSENIF